VIKFKLKALLAYKRLAYSGTKIYNRLAER